MKVVVPSFGVASGMSTTFGLAPHVLVLCFLLFMGILHRSVAALVFFTVAAKVLGEWLFWSRCKDKLDSEKRLKNWRTVLNDSLFSHPNVQIALGAGIFDIMIDTALIYVALECSVPVFWAFLALLGCQAIASPFQGESFDRIGGMGSLLFACTIGVPALLFTLEVHAFFNGNPSITSFVLTKGFGMSSFSCVTQMLGVICFKGLFGNIITVARGVFAEAIVERASKNLERA